MQMSSRGLAMLVLFLMVDRLIGFLPPTFVRLRAIQSISAPFYLMPASQLEDQIKASDGGGGGGGAGKNDHDDHGDNDNDNDDDNDGDAKIKAANDSLLGEEESDDEIDHDGISSTSREQLQQQESNDGIDDNNDGNGDTSSSLSIKSYSDLGDFSPSEKLGMDKEPANVGDPQVKVKEKDKTVTSILLELAAIQQKGPLSYCILGTRHCSYLHQQIIEMLAYALVLSGNHVYTSGAGGTHAATIRGALRAEDPELLTVVLPQSLDKQPAESQQLLEEVEGVIIEMPENDDKTLDVASRICNSYLVNQTDQMIAFAFHESSTVLEATREAREQNKPVTTLFLD